MRRSLWHPGITLVAAALTPALSRTRERGICCRICSVPEPLEHEIGRAQIVQRFRYASETGIEDPRIGKVEDGTVLAKVSLFHSHATTVAVQF